MEVDAVAEGMDDLDYIGTGRGVLWRRGIQFALEKPLFGYGPDNLGFRYLAYHVGTDRPHNELIQFAASLGIPAMLFYVAGRVCHLKDFIGKFKNLNMWQLGIFVVVGGYLVSSLFGNTMFYTSPFFFMLLGMSYRAIRE